MQLQAKGNGEASQFDQSIDDSIKGFSQLAFAERDGDVHVAVVTSLTQNKVRDVLSTANGKTQNKVRDILLTVNGNSF
jgi:hypothetical protein